MQVPTRQAVFLARQVNDQSLPAHDRLYAAMALGILQEEGKVFATVPNESLDFLRHLCDGVNEIMDESKSLAEANKPKYIWRNGARVKVK